MPLLGCIHSFTEVEWSYVTASLYLRVFVKKKLKQTLSVSIRRLQGFRVKTETYFRMTGSPAPLCYCHMSPWHFIIPHSSTSQIMCPQPKVWRRLIKLRDEPELQNIRSASVVKSQLYFPSMPHQRISVLLGFLLTGSSLF